MLRPVNAIVLPVLVSYISVVLGPIMAGLLFEPSGKIPSALAFESVGSPHVRSSEPSGYTPLKPQSSIALLASGFAGSGMVIGPRVNDSLPGLCKPPGEK